MAMTFDRMFTLDIYNLRSSLYEKCCGSESFDSNECLAFGSLYLYGSSVLGSYLYRVQLLINEFDITESV